MSFYTILVSLAVLMVFTVIDDTQASNSCISGKARDLHGSTTWAKSARRSPLRAGDWKCNLFVAEVIRSCRLSAPNRNWWRFSPIGANEWANPSSTYMGNCWRLCWSSSTQEGDVLAIAGNRGSGHVGIVTVPNAMTTSATRYRVVQNDWGFRPGQNPTCWRYNC